MLRADADAYGAVGVPAEARTPGDDVGGDGELMLADTHREPVVALLESRLDEVRQRLVHEEDARVAHDRTPHGDSLALAAGELARLALQQVSEAQCLADTLDTAPDLASRRVPRPQAEGDVLEDGHVRIERVILEDHGHVAAPRVDIVDDLVADQDLAGRYLLEARHHTQRSRLPASRRADEHHELAV